VGNVKGEDVVCSIGMLHYGIAIVLIVDSIIFMAGFSPFFIIYLNPAVYYLVLVYSIAVGSLLYCKQKQSPPPPEDAQPRLPHQT
jgi:hypothetical protein